MDGEVVKVIVAVLGFLGGVVALVTAIVSCRKEVLNRHEFIHRQVGPVGAGSAGSEGDFACTECGGDDLGRIKGVHGTWKRLVLAFLLIWPWVLALVLATNKGSVGDPVGFFAGLFVFMLPGVVFWRVVRRPLLRCADCGARLLPRLARAEPGAAPDRGRKAGSGR